MDDLVDLGMPNFSKPRWLGQNSAKTGGLLILVGGGTVPKSLGDNWDNWDNMTDAEP